MKMRNYKTVFILTIGFCLLLNLVVLNSFVFNHIGKIETQREFPKLAAVPELNDEWYVTWGGNETYGDGAHDLVIDSSGDIYVAGYTFSYGAGHADLALVKFDKNGEVLWYRTWGSVSQDRGYAVALDSSENVYIAGFTDTDPGFDNEHHFCLVKYLKNGHQVWDTTWGTTDWQVCHDMVIDSSDNIYLAGHQDNNLALVKYNSSGDLQWDEVWPGFGYEQFYALALDSSGDIFLAGYTNGGGALGYDMCLVKYNSSGEQQWYNLWGGIGYEKAYAISIDNSDNIYLAGVTTTFTEGKGDICLVKYNNSGTQLWNATWGGDEDDTCSDIVLDSSGNIYLVGEAAVNGLVYPQVAIAKFNNLGQLQWYDTWEDGWATEGKGIALDSSGNAFIALDSNRVTLVKFSSAPKIVIKSPSTNKKCGTIAPNYTLSISEPDLDETWYTLDEGITNITFTGLKGQINQTEWDKFVNGTTVNMRFYATDTSDNVGFADVTVIKEISAGTGGTLPLIPGYYIFIIIGIIGIISIIMTRRLKKE